MGIPIQLWRCRIGSFVQPDKSKTSIRTLKFSGTQVRLSIRLLLALSVLLVMAGVEQSPGPNRGGASTRSASRSSQSRISIGDDGGLGMMSWETGQPFDIVRTLQGIQGELRSLNRNYTDMNTKVDTMFNRLNTSYEQLRMDHEELKTEFSTLKKTL